jgi:peptidyl-prolyl cis-trans isomerase B (cyclophilin B)
LITFYTNLGEICLELDFENTPKTAENFLAAAKAGFFEQTIFHRVIDNFMVQGGGFAPGMVSKESAETIDNEADKGGKNMRGTVAMARTMDPHSASTQFFINVADNDFLNHKAKTPDGWGYCVFGRVVSGMDVVEQMKGVKTGSRAGHQDVPLEDIIVERVEVKASVSQS